MCALNWSQIMWYNLIKKRKRLTQTTFKINDTNINKCQQYLQFICNTNMNWINDLKAKIFMFRKNFHVEMNNEGTE